MPTEPWLTEDENRARLFLEQLQARWPELGFLDLDACTDKDPERRKATLDGRFTSEHLRAIAECMDSLIPKPSVESSDGPVGCTCNATCAADCKGMCGCEACRMAYSDFLSME